MPLDHFSISVPISKFEDLIKFLTTSLTHLGFKEQMRPIPTVVGMGDTCGPFFWMAGIDPTADGIDEKTLLKILSKTHVAFAAQNAKQVDDFHAAGLQAGGKDNGPPGERAHYHPGYYGAFIYDPVCGINFEVVYHGNS